MVRASYNAHTLNQMVNQTVNHLVKSVQRALSEIAAVIVFLFFHLSLEGKKEEIRKLPVVAIFIEA